MKGKNCFYVVGASYQQFKAWQTEQMGKIYHAVYLTNPVQLRGVGVASDDVVFLDGAHEQKNYSEVLDAIQLATLRDNSKNCLRAVREPVSTGDRRRKRGR